MGHKVLQDRGFQGLNQALASHTRYDASSSAICPRAGHLRKGKHSEGLLQSPRDVKQPDFTHGHLHYTTVTALSYKLLFPFSYYFISVQQNQPWDAFVHNFHIMSDAILSTQVFKWEMGQIACTGTC